MRPGSLADATKRPAVTARNAFLSPWRGCDFKGEGCGEETEVGRKVRQVL